MKHCTLTERIDQLLGDGRVADIILRPGIPLRYSIHDRFQIDPDVVVGEEEFASIVKEAGLNCEAKDDDRQWKRGNRSLRCNLLTAQGIPQICMRIFPAKPPLFDDQQCDFPKSPELRQKILEPKKGIIFLVGTPGSGKSTFARKHFLPSELLSSDASRALVSDDENDQAATKEAFEVLHFIAARLRQDGQD